MYLCRLLFFVVGVLLCASAFAVSVDGYCYLNGQFDHSGTKVKFVKVSPSAVTDSTYTNASGYFTKNIVAGIYHVQYLKPGWAPYTLNNQSFVADRTLDPVTLVEELINISGVVTGSLGPAGYRVVGDLLVPNDQTLVIQPGTRFYFSGRYAFQVHGSLSAVGTASDSIIFTREYPNEESMWAGIRVEDSCVYCWGDTVGTEVQFSYCRIEYSRSDSTSSYAGGGLYAGSYTQVVISNCLIRYNRAESGAGVHSYSSSFIMSECMITANETVREQPYVYLRGGGIYISGNATDSTTIPLITDCVLSQNASGNDSVGGFGGGIFSSGRVTIRNCSILDNSANGNGGGAYIEYGSPHFENCMIRGNSGYGAGMYLYGVNNGTVVDCDISQNHSSGDAITLYYCNDLQFLNCTIADNFRHDSSSSGIGISAYADYPGASTVNFDRCTISGNEDGNIQCYNSALSLNSSIISYSDGPGIHFYGSDLSIIQYCDIFGNAGGNIAFLNDDPTHGPPFIGELLTTNINGDSADIYLNIFEDPLFANTANGDYHLLAASACIDAGDPGLDPDPDGSFADQGAFYLEQYLTVTPYSINFGNLDVGIAAQQQVVLQNVSGSPVTVHEVLTSEPVFMVSYNSADSVLLPGESLTITVTFAPDSSAEYSGTVVANTTVGNRSTSLSGRGTGAHISVDPAEANFGTIQPFYYRYLTLRVRNGGNAGLVLAGSGLDGPFSISWMETSVSPGDTGTIELLFSPETEGQFHDTLVLVTNAYNSDTLYVPLTGISETNIVPAPVQDLVIDAQWPDAELCWSPVDTTVNGNPIIVDAYLVYYGEEEGGPYFFHGYTAETCYAHSGVVQFAPSMFYQVTAYVGPVSAVATIPEGSPKEEVLQILNQTGRIERHLMVR